MNVQESYLSGMTVAEIASATGKSTRSVIAKLAAARAYKNREEILKRLLKRTPLVLSVTFSEDMGHEFAAIVESGVIYPQPGMLLTYSGGTWPPDAWVQKDGSEQSKLLKVFLNDPAWDIAPWEDLDVDELLDIAAEVRDLLSAQVSS